MLEDTKSLLRTIETAGKGHYGGLLSVIKDRLDGDPPDEDREALATMALKLGKEISCSVPMGPLGGSAKPMI